MAPKAASDQRLAWRQCVSWEHHFRQLGKGAIKYGLFSEELLASGSLGSTENLLCCRWLVVHCLHDREIQKNMKLNDSLSRRSTKLTNCGLTFLTFLKRKKTPSCRSLPEDSKRITITTLKTWKVGWKTIVDDELQRNFSLNRTFRRPSHHIRKIGYICAPQLLRSNSASNFCNVSLVNYRLSECSSA